MPTFMSDGLELAYTDTPAATDMTGPPVILVHGFASSALVNWKQPGWVSLLSQSGRRVITLDNRGHGASAKPATPEAYATSRMAGDALRLLAHLDIPVADVVGYSMGARIASFMALQAPGTVRRLVLGGLGIHLVEGVGLPMGIADAMEAARLDDLTDPMQRMFRAFAERTGADRAALAACIRGSRQEMTPAEVASITCPVLIAVGTLDKVAGDAHALAKLFIHGQALDILGRDHNLAVGDKNFKAVVVEFLNSQVS
ncbi:MAG: alpha/beta hydrolase [Hyphomicrobiales bacterium]|nr:alpha/beta hydrolase [Hyphomicrobiales bacterium]